MDTPYTWAASYAQSVEQGGGIIGQQRDGVVDALGEVALASASVVENDDLELARVERDLARPAQVVGAQAHDEEQGLALAVDLVVEAGAVRVGEAGLGRRQTFR